MTHELETAPAHSGSDAARSGAKMGRRLVLAAVGAAAVVATTLSPSAGAAGATVNVATNATFGTILTNPSGFALYRFASDVNDKSSCSGACAQVWPALTVPAGTTPTAGPGVTGSVADSLQANGTYQVTYNGSPLYTFVSDTSPGQVSGNNVAGFTVVVVSTPTPSTTAPPPTPGTTVVATTAPTATTTPRSTASTSPPTTAVGTSPAAAPATAAASSATAGSGSSSSIPATSSAPSTLAVTGPGTALIWMVVVGSGLIAISVGMLVAVGDRRRLRGAARNASRTGWWLLGR